MDISEACRVFRNHVNEHSGLHEKAAVPRWESLYSDLIGRAGIAPAARVLDLGTGTGAIALKLAALDSNRGIVGVDIAEGMLKIAIEKKRRLGVKNFDFRLMDMAKLDFPDNVFDAILSNFSVCCVFSYDKTLKEAYRTLKRRGN